MSKIPAVSASGFGSVQNALMGASKSKVPEVGDVCTVIHYRDRAPGVVVQVFPSGKTVFIEELNPVLVSGFLADGTAVYRFERFERPALYAYTLRNTGRWVYRGATNGPILVIGVALFHYDQGF